MQGKCEKRCQDGANRPSNSLWEQIFCSGWGCYRERHSLQVSILQGKCEKRRQDRENRPSNSLWEPILCEGQCGQQEHTVSCAQLPRVLNCCLVIAVMWAHCGDACHALGKTMPDETLARSRQKGKEKKEMKYCRKTALAVGTDGNGKTSAAKHLRGVKAGKRKECTR